MIKAILFDFDGTLANTLPYYIKAYDEALRKFNYQFSQKQIAKNCFGKTEDVICQNLGIPNETKRFRQAYFDAVNKLFKKAKLFKGSLEILKFLKSKKIKIAIITFAYRWYIDQMLKQFNLEDYFDIVIGSDDVIRKKPDPEAILRAEKVLKVKTTEMLVVGDSKSDILMGKAALCKTVLFAPKEHNLFYDFNELKKTNPDFIIENILDLKKIVDN